MEKPMNYSIIFDRVDWDFVDFTSRNFRSDINNLHWYPASFVPQIPDILIQTLSHEGDCVFDPFAGSGVTLVEAARLGRRFIGTDINPFAVEIARAKFLAIENATKDWQEDLNKEVSSCRSTESARDYLERVSISTEVPRWFESKTLDELLCIHEIILNNRRNSFELEKVIFSSILKSCCSQRRHYTYITDGCYPREFKYRPAKKLFMEKVELVRRAAEIFKEQYRRKYFNEYKYDGDIRLADARKIEWINDASVDLIVTSPPYLCTHDYLKAMRLINLFFPKENFKSFLENEIGARYKRQRRGAYEEYVKNMKEAFQECQRVLKRGGFLGMTIGKGKGKVVKSDVIKQLLSFLLDNGFLTIYRNTRKISSRRIRFPGVLTEHVVILEKQSRRP